MALPLGKVRGSLLGRECGCQSALARKRLQHCGPSLLCGSTPACWPAFLAMGCCAWVAAGSWAGRHCPSSATPPCLHKQGMAAVSTWPPNHPPAVQALSPGFPLALQTTVILVDAQVPLDEVTGEVAPEVPEGLQLDESDCYTACALACIGSLLLYPICMAICATICTVSR